MLKKTFLSMLSIVAMFCLFVSDVDRKVAFASDASLLELCKSGSPEQIVAAIKAGANINVKGELGNTVLMTAAAYNSNPDVITVLLEYGADINAQDDAGDTAWVYAAMNNSNSDVVTILLKNGANIPLDQNFSENFLRICKSGRPEEVIAAIKSGADPNAKDNYRTALMWAMENRLSAEVITVLLKNGANVNAKGAGDRTALMLAARSSSIPPDTIEILIKNGANIDAHDESSMTALMYAATNATADAAMILLKNGADINAKDNGGNTALIYAAGDACRDVVVVLLDSEALEQKSSSKIFLITCKFGTPEQVQLAIKGGADVNVRDKLGVTALMYAATYNFNSDVVTTLLKNGADINAKDNNGNTALICAMEANAHDVVATLQSNGAILYQKFSASFAEICRSGTPEQLQAAINAGANVDARDEWGSTALMIAAVGTSNSEVIKILLKNGADIKARNKIGNTALILSAAKNSNPEITKVLIENGGEVNDKDKSGMTALIAAGHSSNPKIIEILIEEGADVNAQDESGRTALMYAAELNNNSDIITALVKSGADVNARMEHASRMAQVSGHKATILMMAANETSNQLVIHALLDAGARNVVDYSANNPNAAAFAMDNPAVRGTSAFRRLGGRVTWGEFFSDLWNNIFR